jgi:hypothetical protein
MDAPATSSGIPKWVWIAAIVGVILVLFLAKQKSASAATPASIQAAPVDPNAAALAETQSAASLGAYQALVQGVTAIDTNANTNAAQLAQTQSSGATLRGLGQLQLKATESNNETTLAVAKVQSSTSKQNTTTSTIGSVIGGIVSVLAIFGL